MSRRNSLGRQAAFRLVLSLGLFVGLIATATALTYQVVLEKASDERAEELASFFKSRLAQVERDWELMSQDLRIRIEFTRILEHPETALINLQAFITTQGADRRFQYLIIQDRYNKKLFSFGKDINLEAIPLAEHERDGYFLNPVDSRLYRIFQDNIWLGEGAGMGWIGIFYRIDNAQLRQLSAPGITLNLFYQGKLVASSAGQAAVDRAREQLPAAGNAYRELSWTGVEGDSLQLRMVTPLRPLLSGGQLVSAMSAIPVLDALILWFSIGMWLIWQTRRLESLRNAVQAFSDTTQITPPLEAQLALAVSYRNDEISEVSQAIRIMASEIVARESEKAKLIANIHERSEQLDTILSATASGIYGIDLNGDTKFVNMSAIKLLGWQENILIGQNLHKIIHHTKLSGEPYSNADCPGFATLSDGVQRTIADDVFWCHDGSTIPVEYTCTPILDQSGAVVGAVVVFSDITDRIGYERERIARLAAEEASVAKSAFVANMSHEIRTPMNAILGLCYLLEKTELKPDQRDYAHKITMAGRSLLGILNDILDFSKIEAHRIDFEQIDFRIYAVFDELSTIMSVSGASKNLELAITADPSIPKVLKGDPSRLQQILINLTGNAIKFTDAGTVSVRADLVERLDEMVLIRFSVRDTGIGLTPEQQIRLFQPFSQADATTTRRFGGTGLGLAISKRLAELMGGTIGVDSTLGQGSEFWFTIPFREGQADGDAVSSTVLDDLEVLIVDDNEIARDSLSVMVRTMGWHDEAVESGEDALQHLSDHAVKGHPYDVLLIDWQMPGMDGLETSRRIKENALSGQAPIVIMVTAFSREEVLRAPDAAVLDAVLVKPLTPSVLYNAVAEIDASRRGGAGELVPRCHAADMPRLPGIRVLVAEDNAINQDVVRKILEREGAIVEVVGDGQQAVDRIQKQHNDFDVLVMDAQMPVMDGFEATSRIRAELSEDDLPIIAVTAGVQQADRDLCSRVGMNDFVAKPLDVEILVRSILRHATPRPDLLPKPIRVSSDRDGLASGKAPFDAIPGMDVRQALLRFGGDQETLVKMLQRLAANTIDWVTLLRADLDAGNSTQALRCLHTFKGSAGNVGVTGLASLAGTIEAAIQAGRAEEGAALLEPLAVATNEFREAVATAFYSRTELVVETAQISQEHFEQLISQLREGSLAALDTYNSLSSALKQSLTAERHEELITAIERLDFAAAAVALDGTSAHPQ